MFSSKILASVSVFAAGFSTVALATAPQVRIVPGSLTARGAGCPDASTVFYKILNDTTVSFEFQNLFASTVLTNLALDTKNCIVDVDVEVPAGYRVAPGTVREEATVNGISETGSVTAYARYYLDGKASALIGKTYSSADAPANGESLNMVLESADVSHNPDVWSETCGGTYKLNLQSRAIARRGATDQGFSEIFIDRARGNVGQHKISCGLVLKPCGMP